MGTEMIPYEDRAYDILFCGTYYRPESQIAEISRLCPENSTLWKLYQETFKRLKNDSCLSGVQGLLLTINQMGLNLSEKNLKSTLNISISIFWAGAGKIILVRAFLISTGLMTGFPMGILCLIWRTQKST